ncbi:MAG: transposase, partial [Treponema sp.]|nr:transposase [Treponema sp.]
LGKEAIGIIGELYGIEGELREAVRSGRIDADTFVLRRKERAAPVVKAFHDWLDRRVGEAPPESSLGKAIGYSRKALPLAERYVEQYLLSPDTNAVENAIRPFVLGRKGWLFCGSPRGAHAGAGIYSLIETAKANGHEPYRYLCYVFDRLPGAKTPEDIDALLPYNLSPAGTTPTG